MLDVTRQTYPFQLPDLPYPYGAMEPHLDETTMRIHHDKHHKTYVDKLNEALAGEPELHKTGIVELLRDLDKLPEKIRGAVKNNGGGHYNHELYWHSLAPTPEAREPQGELAKAIDAQYGGFDAFREKFNGVAAKHFASGWVALVLESSGKLAILDLKDHEAPRPWDTTPLLIVDVWEHAYYVKFQNRRPEFLGEFWKVIDWRKADERFREGRAATRV